MTQGVASLAFLRPLTWRDAALIALIVVSGAVLVQVIRAIVRRAAEGAPSHRRLMILRAAPLSRLAIGMAGLGLIVPILVEPNFEDVVALLATVVLALAFALKDYLSCVIAGLVTVLENIYQPGDWIEWGGAYGEVTSIGLRAVRLMTSDNTEVTIPHSKLWSASLANSSKGRNTLLTVTPFFLRADHDGAVVRDALTDVAKASPYLKAGSPVRITAVETPFGTHFKIKAYVAESRDQFAMITDLTLRGKARLRALGVAFAQAPYGKFGE